MIFHVWLQDGVLEYYPSNPIVAAGYHPEANPSASLISSSGGSIASVEIPLSWVSSDITSFSVFPPELHNTTKTSEVKLYA